VWSVGRQSCCDYVGGAVVSSCRPHETRSRLAARCAPRRLALYLIKRLGIGFVMLCSLARPVQPCRTFLFVTLQIGLQLPPQPGSLQRRCLRLVLCQSEFSFGILISLRIPVSHRGLKPHKLMPMTGGHNRVHPSGVPLGGYPILMRSHYAMLQP
jgi:hypothetical protein